MTISSSLWLPLIVPKSSNFWCLIMAKDHWPSLTLHFEQKGLNILRFTDWSSSSRLSLVEYKVNFALNQSAILLGNMAWLRGQNPKTLLHGQFSVFSSVTHVPSELMDCALAA